MGLVSERRKKQAVGFRSAGTHFRFKNGWQVRVLTRDPVSVDLHYEVSIYDPGYHALSVKAGASSLAKADADCVAAVMAAVRGFAEETAPEGATEAIAALLG